MFQQRFGTKTAKLEKPESQKEQGPPKQPKYLRLILFYHRHVMQRPFYKLNSSSPLLLQEAPRTHCELAAAVPISILYWCEWGWHHATMSNKVGQDTYRRHKLTVLDTNTKDC
ncbi:hypothetical protein GOODEAATRI_022776 [Goodea atripinnis]|uniref:Uncharacterized protein n=1 Tax=Goodea atripinnis TaxID=208336 RepID=A0ABV0Q078_9TELE